MPDEMLPFKVFKTTASTSARLGRLVLPGRKPLATPHYITSTSRGVVPHLSPDNLRQKTSIGGLYIPLEDFIEKAPNAVPPIYVYDLPNHESQLRRFCALPDDATLVLGARRVPPLPCPKSNTSDSIAISTSVGFQQVTVDDFVIAAASLKPDIVASLADVPPEKPSLKRVEKMGERTEAWLKLLVKAAPQAQIFAPILPVAPELQSYYLDSLQEEDLKDIVKGLVFYDTNSIGSLPPSLMQLPRLASTNPSSPSAMLQEISLGVDILTTSFINTASDAGIALDFCFPPNTTIDGSTSHPLGIDMWADHHATDISPLVESCSCYTCSSHHRAYLQHLLTAKEMLAWVLLQIHNYHVIEQFFVGVRQTIEKGNFESSRTLFERVYDRDLPDKTGQGPRIRGYQVRSDGPSPAKRNPKAYGRLDDTFERLAEADRPGPDINATQLEQAGMGKKV